MNKIVISLVFAATSLMSSASFAAASGTACAGATTATAGTSTGTPGTGEFIQNAFTPQCSANVHLQWAQSATAVGVGSASTKGRNYFGGSSNGGGVQPTGTKCPDTGCVATGLGDIASSKVGSGT